MKSLSLLFLAALASAGPAAAQAERDAPVSVETNRIANYASDSTWLCLPGRSDVCSTPLATTALNPNGYGSTGRSSVARNAPIDCFYVYPTVSRDPGLNSDMRVAEERAMADCPGEP